MSEENNQEGAEDNTPKDTTDYKALYEQSKSKLRELDAKVSHFEKTFSNIDPEKYKALGEEVEILRQEKAGVDPEAMKAYKQSLERDLRAGVQKDVDDLRAKAQVSTSKLKTYMALSEVTKAGLLDPKAMDLLMPMIDKQTKLIDDQVVVINKDGEPRYSPNNPNQAFTLKNLAEELAEAYPFAAVNQTASGSMNGGQKVNGTSGTSFESYLKMTNAERVKAFTPDERVKYSSMAMSMKGN